MGGMNLGIIGGIHFNVGSQTDKSPSSCQPFHSRLGNPIPIFCHQSSGSCFLPSSASAGHNLTSTLNTINIFSLHHTIFLTTLSRSQWPSQRSLISFPSTSTTTLSRSLSSSASASSPVISVSPPRDLSSFRWSRMEKLSELGSRQN